MHQGRYRNWCFTSNNPSTLLDPSEWPRCTYCIYSEEVSESGTHHFQGYLELNGAHPLSTVRDYGGLEGAHLEPRHKTQAQAMNYCQKVDDPTFIDGPYVWGTLKQQGKRVDLEDVAQMVGEGASLATIASEHPSTFMKFHSGITKFQLLQQPTRREGDKPACMVFFGSGGSGKSTFASRLANYLGESTYNLPMSKGSGTYWDKYQQGDVVVINEMNGNRFQPSFLNSLLDGGAFQVPTHGGSTEFNSPYIIITTNVHPKLWWRTAYKHSLMRRITLFPTFRRLDGPCWLCPTNAVSWHQSQFTHRKYDWRAAHAAGAHTVRRSLPIDVISYFDVSQTGL